MPDKQLAHPLKWWQFYVACVRHAGSGVLGVIGDVGTIIGVSVYSFKLLAPTYYRVVGLYLTAHGYRENALIEIPLWAGAVILFVRLITAPFVIYRDKPQSPKMGPGSRPKVSVSYDPRDDEPGKSISIHNGGDEAAFKIRGVVFLPYTTHGLRIFASGAVAARATEHHAPMMLLSGKPSGLPAKNDVLENFLLTARTASHDARGAADNQRITAAREAGDHNAMPDERAFRDYIFARTESLKHLGSDVVAQFDLQYENYEGTWLYSTPHQIRIGGVGLIEITRFGLEQPPVAISTATGPHDASIVIEYRRDPAEPDTDQSDVELLCFRNVGGSAVTNVTLHPLDIAGRRIEFERVNVLVPNEPETTLRIFGLHDALWRARHKMPAPPRGQRALPLNIKLIVEASDYTQRDPLPPLEYVLADRGIVGGISITRVDPNAPPVEWTDLAALGAS